MKASYLSSEAGLFLVSHQKETLPYILLTAFAKVLSAKKNNSACSDKQRVICDVRL